MADDFDIPSGPVDHLNAMVVEAGERRDRDPDLRLRNLLPAFVKLYVTRELAMECATKLYRLKAFCELSGDRPSVRNERGVQEAFRMRAELKKLRESGEHQVSTRYVTEQLELLVNLFLLGEPGTEVAELSDQLDACEDEAPEDDPDDVSWILKIRDPDDRGTDLIRHGAALARAHAVGLEELPGLNMDSATLRTLADYLEGAARMLERGECDEPKIIAAFRIAFAVGRRYEQRGALS